MQAENLISSMDMYFQEKYVRLDLSSVATFDLPLSMMNGNIVKIMFAVRYLGRLSSVMCRLRLRCVAGHVACLLSIDFMCYCATTCMACPFVMLFGPARRPAVVIQARICFRRRIDGEVHHAIPEAFWRR